MTVNYESYIGKTFGNLTVLCIDHEERTSNRKRVYLKCQDTRGKIRVVRYDSLKRDRLKTIYYKMLDRCYNSKNYEFGLYGGRGIKICEEWKNSFTAFKKWALLNGYDDKLSIDRIDNNGNYEPKNCRWATALEQQLNKRNNRRIFFNGKNLCLSEWCKIINVKHNTFLGKLKKHNWTYEETLRSYIGER